MTSLLLLPLTMTLMGIAAWWRLDSRVVGLVLLLATAALAWAVHRAARTSGLPLAVAAATATTTALALDALSGGMLQHGSLLNPGGWDSGRWYGFGNLTFAVYASSSLVVVGYLGADRPHRRIWTAVAVGVAVLVTDGSPSLGADLGGAAALGPPMIALLVVLSGPTLSLVRLLLAGAGGLVLLALGQFWTGPADRRDAPTSGTSSSDC